MLSCLPEIGILFLAVLVGAGVMLMLVERMTDE